MNAEENPTGDWDFTMWLNVKDVDLLHDAASKHPDCEDPAELKNKDGSINNIRACLIMLLDPGSLPGCTIQASNAETADV
jgi:hypothetical protein